MLLPTEMFDSIIDNMLDDESSSLHRLVHCLPWHQCAEFRFRCLLFAATAAAAAAVFRGILPLPAQISWMHYPTAAAMNHLHLISHPKLTIECLRIRT
jgi:hypothetical protein